MTANEAMTQVDCNNQVIVLGFLSTLRIRFHLPPQRPAAGPAA